MLYVALFLIRINKMWMKILKILVFIYVVFRFILYKLIKHPLIIVWLLIVIAGTDVCISSVLTEGELLWNMGRWCIYVFGPLAAYEAFFCRLYDWRDPVEVILNAEEFVEYLEKEMNFLDKCFNKWFHKKQ